MEEQNNNPNQVPPTPIKSGFSSLAMIYLLLGILIGITVILAYQRYLPQVARTVYTFMLGSFGVLVLSFVLLYAFKRQITAFFFGSATANAREVIEDAQRVTDALTDRFADTLLRDVDSGVRDRVRHVLPRLANWFIWSRFRNWWWQWVLGIFVSLGGLTGTLLLMNQNELLQNQNALIQQQMFLSEASRKSALVVLMSNIMDKVDGEITDEKEELYMNRLSKAAVDTMRFSLSQSLIGQIAALSYSFKPYRYMEGNNLIKKSLSPERGQLLITLTLLPLDTATLYKIYKLATFESADLQGADLGNSNLSGANLNGANLSGAYLNGANLSGANLTATNLNGANLNGASLNGAYLSEANLNGAYLSEANLRVADLSVANLSEAILSEADLSGANLSGAHLTINQLSESKSLFGCEKNLHDSLKLPLQQSHPQLFQKPKEE
jgi:hypothetical protein